MRRRRTHGCDRMHTPCKRRSRFLAREFAGSSLLGSSSARLGPCPKELMQSCSSTRLGKAGLGVVIAVDCSPRLMSARDDWRRVSYGTAIAIYMTSQDRSEVHGRAAVCRWIPLHHIPDSRGTRFGGLAKLSILGSAAMHIFHLLVYGRRHLCPFSAGQDPPVATAPVA